jgi:hypothetical protein
MILQEGNIPKQFQKGVDYIMSRINDFPAGYEAWFEYLEKPKHNTLAYSRIPLNHLVLFACREIATQNFLSVGHQPVSEAIGVEHVPILFVGKINTPDDLKSLLDRESYLGGCKIEGVVVKNYSRTIVKGDLIFPIMSAKYVSEAFKEIHIREAIKGLSAVLGNKLELVERAEMTSIYQNTAGAALERQRA